MNKRKRKKSLKKAILKMVSRALQRIYESEKYDNRKEILEKEEAFFRGDQYKDKSNE